MKRLPECSCMSYSLIVLIKNQNLLELCGTPDQEVACLNPIVSGMLP